MNAIATDIPIAAAKATRMRLRDVLSAPRYAGTRARQGWAIGSFALFAAGALAGGIWIPDREGPQLAPFIYAFGTAILGMWWSGLLLVARDARRLCLPGIVRNTATAASLYTAIALAAPALLVGTTGGDLSQALLFPALALTGVLAFLLLPRWAALWLSFAPAIYIGLHNAHLVPSLLDPRLQVWGWPALLVLVLADVIRWRQLLDAGDNDDPRWRSPVLLQFRRNMVTRDWGIDHQWAWRRSSNRATAVDFRGMGSAQPAKAIRFALAQIYVPQTWRTRLASVGRGALWILLFIPVMWLMNLGDADSMRKIWLVMGISMGGWLGVGGALMLAFGVAAIVQRRWKDQAGIALLALLPGLGRERAAQYVLRAVLTAPTIAFIVLWLGVLIGMAFLYPNPITMLLVSLFDLAMAALTLMTVIRAVGGRPVGMVALGILGVVILVLVNVSVILASIGGATGWHGTPFAEWLAVLAWAILIAWAAWQTHRAWHVLQRRPHPFLANS